MTKRVERGARHQWAEDSQNLLLLGCQVRALPKTQLSGMGNRPETKGQGKMPLLLVPLNPVLLLTPQSKEHFCSKGCGALGSFRGKKEEVGSAPLPKVINQKEHQKAEV